MKKMTFAVLLLAACVGRAAQATALPDNEALAALARADQGDRTGEIDWKAASDEGRQALSVPRLQDKLAEIAENNKKRQAK